MSSGLMQTEKGGEQTQYEAEHEDVKPRAQASGQFGTIDSNTAQPLHSSNSEGADGPPSRTGEAKAEKIRFGQAVSEKGGVSGFTDQEHSSGSATNDGGFGGEQASEGDVQPGQSRREQGYDAKHEMNREVGA